MPGHDEFRGADSEGPLRDEKGRREYDQRPTGLKIL